LVAPCCLLSTAPDRSEGSSGRTSSVTSSTFGPTPEQREIRVMATNFVGWVSTLARTHARSLAAGAVREGLTRLEAIDAVQEAFTTLLRLPQARELSLDDEGAERLMAVLVRNAARNMRRRRHRSSRHEPLEDVLEVPADAPSVDALLIAAEEHVA